MTACKNCVGTECDACRAIRRHTEYEQSVRHLHQLRAEVDTENQELKTLIEVLKIITANAAGDGHE